MQTPLTFKKTALAVLIGSLLSGCFESSSSDNDTPVDDKQAEEQRVSITGFAVKGLLNKATVTAYRLDNREQLASVLTESDGSYTLPDIDYDGAVLVELTTNEQTTK